MVIGMYVVAYSYFDSNEIYFCSEAEISRYKGKGYFIMLLEDIPLNCDVLMYVTQYGTEF